MFVQWIESLRVPAIAAITLIITLHYPSRQIEFEGNGEQNAAATIPMKTYLACQISDHPTNGFFKSLPVLRACIPADFDTQKPWSVCAVLDACISAFLSPQCKSSPSLLCRPFKFARIRVAIR